jgi:hypothetical protein
MTRGGSTREHAFPETSSMSVRRAAIKPESHVDIGDVRVFRAENFPASGDIPWLDRPDWRECVAALERAGTIDPAQAAHCRHWAEQGYLILPGLFASERLDRAWKGYDRLIENGTLVPSEDYGSGGENPLPGRVLNPHLHLPQFDELLRDHATVELVSLLLGAPALPFQTISGHKGTQQKAHSDSIHMTTYPQGYLVANWIAFEDIAPDSGPLIYYPGSHRLPYVYSRECGITLDEGRHGYDAYHARYETRMQREIAEHALQPAYFHARKGDVLFWHANLLHGGSGIENHTRSRRSLVCHYFAEGCICYHDYSGTPSYLTEIPKLSAEQFGAEDYLRLNPDVAAAGVDAYQHYLEFGFAENRRVR